MRRKINVLCTKLLRSNESRELLAELGAMSVKAKETSKTHESDLRVLRKGIELLEKGLLDRSEKSLSCLDHIDSSFEKIEDKIFSSHDEGQSTVLSDFRHLVPQLRQDMSELRSILNISRKRPATQKEEVSTLAPQQSAEGNARPAKVEQLLDEYQAALAKSQLEAQALRSKLSSCLDEKSALREELEEKTRALVSRTCDLCSLPLFDTDSNATRSLQNLKEEREADQIASARAREAATLKSLQHLESEVEVFSSSKASYEKQVTVLKAEAADMAKEVSSLREENTQLYRDHENLSAFGVKQKNEIDELKHLLSMQKKDIRAALAMLLSFKKGDSRADMKKPLHSGEGTSDFGTSEGEEESSHVLDTIEQEMAELDQELSILQKTSIA